jgi:hypothetical protein
LIKSQSLHTFEGNGKDADSSPELSASVFLRLFDFFSYFSSKLSNCNIQTTERLQYESKTAIIASRLKQSIQN